MAVTAEDFRRRVAGWRRAELREHAIRAQRGPMEPAAAMNAAFELYDLLPVDISDPDETRIREIAFARRAWQTLRIRLTGR